MMNFAVVDHEASDEIPEGERFVTSRKLRTDMRDRPEICGVSPHDLVVSLDLRRVSVERRHPRGHRVRVVSGRFVNAFCGGKKNRGQRHDKNEQTSHLLLCPTCHELGVVEMKQKQIVEDGRIFSSLHRMSRCVTSTWRGMRLLRTPLVSAQERTGFQPLSDFSTLVHIFD